MTLRASLVEAIAAWLEQGYPGPVTVSHETDTTELLPPYAVVRISSAEPLAPMELIWDLTALIAVSHDADATPATTAEERANELFAKMEGEDNLADFIAFCEEKGLAISTMFPLESNLTVADGHWVHILGVRLIAALSEV